MGCSGNLPRFVHCAADRDYFFLLGAFGSCIAWKTESTHVASSCLSKATVDVSILGSVSSIPDGAVFPASAHPYSSLREGKCSNLQQLGPCSVGSVSSLCTAWGGEPACISHALM